jgi:hypothetical protein
VSGLLLPLFTLLPRSGILRTSHGVIAAGIMQSQSEGPARRTPYEHLPYQGSFGYRRFQRGRPSRPHRG